MQEIIKSGLDGVFFFFLWGGGLIAKTTLFHTFNFNQDLWSVTLKCWFPVTGTVVSLAPSITSVWVDFPVFLWSGMRLTQHGDRLCCCSMPSPVKWGCVSKGATRRIWPMTSHDWINDWPCLAFLSHLLRYRLVPYGNHSYLESLSDKSKVIHGEHYCSTQYSNSHWFFWSVILNCVFFVCVLRNFLSTALAA